ncbi:hypothetical protein PIB30_016557 [Stylosanthes scabra]|uniref:Uncharacterized protein n=1 Tax=Stylosanthes scabra TaxID=79078 RepID=A0ABU6R7R2_9FABA|nr:hypothetical protein [Stylosanthes scabra]
MMKKLGEMCSMWRLTLEGEIVEVQVLSPAVLLPTWTNKWHQSRWLIGLVLRSIYERHRKSSRHSDSSGKSCGVIVEVQVFCVGCGVFTSCVPSLGSSLKSLPSGFAPRGGPTSGIRADG